ncbi:probable protein phosphatase 2c 52-like [Plasmopara halstedii]|uniref:Probable protein phosphatase 2c 52-like n=1 Tax=Plasmopara halstedii TaxID=4781 RepID=A0A0P1AAD1_PLAHL|nr:probable protein phosphatase 2c 52-like [Plasmopara halstedii]CEG37311.1 probable protein phosphatase 2c 52-like [Plasmopara halstedii]|eukprot:XP_024573680.1 probable protein phosphatase 2c 52-like [Plasmopara halstedii]
MCLVVVIHCAALNPADLDPIARHKEIFPRVSSIRTIVGSSTGLPGCKLQRCSLCDDPDFNVSVCHTSVRPPRKRQPSTYTNSNDFDSISKELEGDDIYDVPVGISTDRGGKPNQEDVYFIGGKVAKRLTLNGYSSSVSGCFGVFDGHAGDRASRYCAEKIFPLILEQLAQRVVVKDAITSAVRALDADFCTYARRASNSALSASARHSHNRSFATDDGSTLLIALVRDGFLHVGNVGDSRAVVVTRFGDAIAMSDDQKPNRKDERRRLEARGAFVTGKPDFMYRIWPLKKIIDVPRVNGQLAMSRSIGDVTLKPYISCDPEIQSRKLSKNDRFLIMATDGLWDVVSSKRAAKIAICYKDPQAVANALVGLALQRHTCDNITVLVVKLEAYDFNSSRTDLSSF